MASLIMMFFVLEAEAIDENTPVTDQLFVEVYGGRDAFIELVMRVLDKTDELEAMLADVEASMKFSKNFMGVLGDELEEELDVDSTNTVSTSDGKPATDVNEVLKKAIHLVENADKIEFSKFIKIYTEKNGKRNLGVSHSRLNNLAKEKKLSTISFPSNYKTCTKSFTNLTATVSTGRSNTGSAFCTLVPVQEVGEEVRSLLQEKMEEKIEVIDIESVDASDAATATAETDVVMSQDFPTLTQSVTGETMLVCDICDFMTRSKTEFKRHEEAHPACQVCGRRFISMRILEDHMNEEHDFFKCDHCNASVKTVDKANHVKMHEMLVTHEAALGATSKSKNKKAKSLKPMNSWLIFCQDNRKEERERNPNLTATEITAILSIKWKALGKEGQKVYADKAEEAKRLKEATDTNVTTTSLVSSLTPSVASVPHSDDQTRIHQCGHCGSPFVTEDALKNHMQEEHSTGRNYVEYEEDSEESDETSFHEGQIVLVKLRNRDWPAKVHHVDIGKGFLTVQVYNPPRTIKKVSMKCASTFYEMKEFKGNLPKGWKTGYLEALTDFKLT